MKLRNIAIAIGILLMIGILLIGGIVFNAFAPVLQQYGLQIQSADQITKETSQADFAMREREWFAQQRQDIQAMKNKIENQRRQIEDFKKMNDMSDLSYTQQKQYNRMTNRLLGYRNQYETYVADYNAKMNVSYFRQYNQSLPLEMEDKFWTGDLIP